MKKLLMSAAALALLSGVAWAAGNWETLPTATTVVGTEYVPADTGNAQGLQPQAVRLSVNQLRANKAQFLDYVSGNITLDSGVTAFWLTDSGTITATTVTLPPNPVDGQRIRFFSNVAITTLTVASGAGATLDTTYAAPTTMTANTSWEYVYIAAQGKWYRFA